MRCKKKKIPPLLLWAEKVDQKVQKHSAKPLDETDFSEAARKRIWKKIRVGKPDECWEWTGARNQLNYGVLQHRGRQVFSHRVVLVISGVPLGKFYALHSCDNPPCCNPNHLRLGTSLDNARDACERKRFHGRRDALAGYAKLTPQTVLEIRDKSKRGMTGRAIAAQYGVVPSTIYQALSGRRWKDVAMPKLTPQQLHANAEALHALADGKQIEYYSPVLAKWCDCEDVCMEFEHRVKPEQEPAHKEQAPVSLRVEDY